MKKRLLPQFSGKWTRTKRHSGKLALDSRWATDVQEK